MKIYRSILILLGVLLHNLMWGQTCDLTISGLVQDLGTGNGLAQVHIHLQEEEKEQITDSNGRFTFRNICAGKYHVSFNHIGCEAYDLFLVVSKDTSIVVQMDHSFHVSKGVSIKGKAEPNTIQRSEVLGEREIEENPDENLGNMLEGITGVSTLKNGNSISKPVVHGLYGNRITILNNGIAQAGQQWGNDHSPEIDPQSANGITVIKGVSALQYLGLI